jgi:hypothetical protein
MSGRRRRTDTVTDWRAKGLELLPEFAAEIQDAETPMQLWIELCFAFDLAYEEPRQDDLIRRIYAFATWGLMQNEEAKQADHHLPTCVVICFYEHIPRNPSALADIPRWFTHSEFRSLEAVFCSQLSENEYSALLDLCPVGERKRRKICRKQ